MTYFDFWDWASLPSPARLIAEAKELAVVRC